MKKKTIIGEIGIEQQINLKQKKKKRIEIIAKINKLGNRKL